MNDERFLSEWLRDESPDDSDPRASADLIMTRIPETPQRRRWWPFSPHRRAPSSPPDGGPATIAGRTKPMFDATKALTAGVLVAVVGGALFIAQPFAQDGGGSTIPGAAVDADPVPPVEVTARFINGPSVGQDTWAGKTGSGGDRWAGGAWEWRVDEDPTDPRLVGTVTMSWNHDEYPTSPGQAQGMTVSHQTLQIVNEQGAWRSLPVVYLTDASSPAFTIPMTLVGEGAYEGTYIVGDFVTSTGSEWELSGLIFTGDLPSVPAAPGAE